MSGLPDHNPYLPNHSQARQIEEWQRQAEEAEVTAEIARLSEGSEPCQGDHCDGRGRTVEAGEDCGYCAMIEHAIWLAGEPNG
jgi:hypothetical protein